MIVARSPAPTEPSARSKTSGSARSSSAPRCSNSNRVSAPSRAGAFEDEAHLLGGLGGVDGDVDRAEAEDGEVDDRPVGPVLREQRHAVALADAERGEAQGDGAHA